MCYNISNNKEISMATITVLTPPVTAPTYAPQQPVPRQAPKIVPISGPDSDLLSPELCSTIEKVVKAKETLFQRSFGSGLGKLLPLRRFDASLIGGDIFNSLYLSFQGIRSILAVSSTHLSSGVASTLACASLVLGIAAGAINIGVGLLCLADGIHKLKAGDKLSGIRLLIDGALSISIGIVMILAQAAFVGFFAAHPYILAILFAIMTLPLLYECSKRCLQIFRDQDVASQFFKALGTTRSNPNITQGNIKWKELSSLFPELEKAKTRPKDAEQLICDLMQRLEAEIGVRAGKELLDLVSRLGKGEANLDDQKLRKEVRRWNVIQSVRLLQQIIYILATPFSLVSSFTQGTASLACDSAQSMLLAVANFIPLILDLKVPDGRNVPVAIDPVEPKDLIHGEASPLLA